MIGSADTSSKRRSPGPAARARRAPDAGSASQVSHIRSTAATPGSPGPNPEKGRRMDLSTVVECEIIPRLMLAHTDERREAVIGAGMGRDVINAFAMLALETDAERMLSFVSDEIGAGRSLTAVYLDLLAPAARRLGEMWSDDEVAYSDVTIALGRLQHLIRLLNWKFPPNKGRPGAGRTALFAPAPGEHHMFGLIMVEDQFRRAGWRTWLETHAEPDALVRISSHHSFDVVGFSLGNAGLADRLAVLIRQIRVKSKNRHVLILVGGNALEKDPLLFKFLGADATASDGFQALTIAGERVCHQT